MKSQKICAIICEFNPLTNGHKYIIEQARKISGCDFIMCIMSGNFTQRGEPSILNKQMRAKLALLAGADIVVHLPTAYSCASAEVFALAGIKIANSFKNVTHIMFGSELGELEPLLSIAKYLNNEPRIYKTLLKNQLSLGNSYNSSRIEALNQISKTDKSLPQNTKEILSCPNNILAVEYLKALLNIDSKIIPITTKRLGEDYNSKKLNSLSSASAIREEIYNNKSVKNISKSMPENIYEEFKNLIDSQGLVDIKLFNQLCLFKLRTTPLEQIKEIFDVVEGFENRIFNLSKQSATFEQFLKESQTKRYSKAKITRIVTGLMLGIDKRIIEQIYKNSIIPYVKVLAVRKNKILNNLQSNTCVVLRTNDVKKTNNYFYNKLIEIENNADSIYTLLNNLKVVEVPYIYQPPIINSKLT